MEQRSSRGGLIAVVRSSRLRPESVDLKLTLFGRTTMLVRIEGVAAKALKGMPTMIDATVGRRTPHPLPRREISEDWRWNRARPSVQLTQ